LLLIKIQNFFLSNPELSPFLRNSDCSQVSDGASALILVSENGLNKLGLISNLSNYVEILTTEYACGNLYEDDDETQLVTTKVVADRAFHNAKLSVSNMDIGEVHDCFSIAEIQMYEALGLAKYGEGTKLVKEGQTEIKGKIPINTGGGLIAFGHPVGATGVKQILEIFRQMKGQCGEYQVPKIPKFGIAANMGGSDKTAVVTIIKNLNI